MKNNAYVSGIPVYCGTFLNVLHAIEQSINKNLQRRYISITNTEAMYHADKDKNHFNYIKNADFSLCDGIGSVIAGKFWGYNIPRLNGPILMLKACEYGIGKRWRHFLYGGQDGVANLLAKNLEKKFPGIIIAGTHTPSYFEEPKKESEKVLNKINRSRPNIVWVGLGLPKQEKWIKINIKHIKANWVIGVGGAFDYHAGTIPYAPKWIQKIGMEWLFRTIIEPHNRVKRYYWSFQFMFKSIFEAIFKK
jgi:N-acetylglucosaminyldiphosphoundecaprenol N-acetyl-beta-D-mannosaminyltransferase